MLFSDKLLGAAHEAGAIPFWASVRLRLATMLLTWQNGCLWLLQKVLFKRDPGKPRRILVFRTGSLGDSICAIPAIRAVAQKYPDAAIDILTNAGRKSLIGLHHMLQPGEYHEIIDYAEYPKKQLFALLRKGQYDLVVQLPQVDAPFISLVRDLLFFRAIAPAGLGWYKSQVTWFRKTQSRYLQFPNEMQRLLWIMEKSGFNPSGESLILTPSTQDVQTAKALLQEAQVNLQRPLIAVVVGAKRPQNRWPIAYFKQVAEQLTDQNDVVLIGSGEDNELVQPLTAIKNVVNACGKLTPMQSAAMLSLCAITISNDTGPMHLAYAVGTPTIALFSSRDLPGKWYPPADKHIVFRAGYVPCQACFSEHCADNICMQAILPGKVIDRARELLRALPAQPTRPNSTHIKQ